MDEVITKWGGEKHEEDSYIFPSPARALKCLMDLEAHEFDLKYSIKQMQDVLYIREK